MKMQGALPADGCPRLGYRSNRLGSKLAVTSFYHCRPVKSGNSLCGAQSVLLRKRKQKGSARLGAPFVLIVRYVKFPGGYWVMRSISATRTLIFRTEESTAEIMGALD